MAVWEDYAGKSVAEGEMWLQSTSFAFLTWTADIPSFLVKKKTEPISERSMGLVRPFAGAKEQLS